jgi:hypothetical protein
VLVHAGGGGFASRASGVVAGLTRVQDELNEGPANLEMCASAARRAAAARPVAAHAVAALAAAAADAFPRSAANLVCGGSAALTRVILCRAIRYEKPCDVTKKKVKLLTVKPLFLHVNLSGEALLHSRLLQSPCAAALRPAPSSAPHAPAVRNFAL